MALVKKGPFFMAFYGHETLIIISYHFNGFLWLRTNSDLKPVFINKVWCECYTIIYVIDDNIF